MGSENSGCNLGTSQTPGEEVEMLWLPREGARRERERKYRTLEPLPRREVGQCGSRNDGFRPQEKAKAERTTCPREDRGLWEQRTERQGARCGRTRPQCSSAGRLCHGGPGGRAVSPTAQATVTVHSGTVRGTSAPAEWAWVGQGRSARPRRYPENGPQNTSVTTPGDQPEPSGQRRSHKVPLAPVP